MWRLQEELLHLQQKIEELGSANRAPQLQERVRALKGELGVARAAPPNAKVKAAGGAADMDRTVRAIFTKYGLPLVDRHGAPIPDELLKRTFSEGLQLTKKNQKHSEHQRKLLVCVSSFLYHLCGAFNSDNSALFDHAMQSVAKANRAPKHAVESSAQMARALVATAKAALTRGESHEYVSQIVAPLTVSFTRGRVKEELDFDVSERLWKYARWHAVAFGAFEPAPENKTWRLRFDESKIASTLAFLEKNTHYIACGEHHSIPGPGGEMIDIPPMLRDEVRGVLYKRYVEEEKAARRKPMGRTEFTKFAGKVANKDPIAMSALDSGAQRGKEALNRLDQVHLEELKRRAGLDEEATARIRGALALARESTAALQDHLANNSLPAAANHCLSHLLCDPEGKDDTRPGPCTHTHSGMCEGCDAHRVARVLFDDALVGLRQRLESQAAAAQVQGQEQEQVEHAQAGKEVAEAIKVSVR